MARKIFINYRRRDSPGHTGRVHDRLSIVFDADLLFMDVDSIPLGADFVEELQLAVSTCSVLLAVIGPGWLDARDDQGRRRLLDPGDYVRIEIRAALDRNIPVIPIVVGGASMPAEDALPDDIRALARRQGLIVHDDSFHSDLDRLIETLQTLLHRPPRSGDPSPDPTGFRRPAPGVATVPRAVSRGAQLAEFQLMIFWHRYGLREQDAVAMRSSLERHGIACQVSRHYNDRAPDAFFVRYDADVELVREVLESMPDPPQYIFPFDYPNDECGARSPFDMSVGLHAIHRYHDDDPAETPHVLDRGDLDYLVEPGLSQVEFAHRLHEIAPSRRAT